jgi:hypothetical protein
MSVDLAEFTSDVNIIEIFLCQKNTTNPMVYDTVVDPVIIKSIESRFKNPKIASFKSYHMHDKVYTYELSNDNQLVHSKYMVKHHYIIRDRKALDMLMVASKLEKYPPYIFPCTNEIDYISSYTLKEFKINNRVAVFIKTEDNTQSVYIEYKHSQNVELDKINEIINRLIKTL